MEPKTRIQPIFNTFQPINSLATITVISNNCHARQLNSQSLRNDQIQNSRDTMVLNNERESSSSLARLRGTLFCKFRLCENSIVWHYLRNTHHVFPVMFCERKGQRLVTSTRNGYARAPYARSGRYGVRVLARS